MAGTIDGLDSDNKSAFMDIQQQLSMPHHQAYSSMRNYQGPGSAHDAFAQAQAPRSLSGYPFAQMNNSSLHNSYSHHSGHSYLSPYPPNVTTCPPCSSPPRDGELIEIASLNNVYKLMQVNLQNLPLFVSFLRCLSFFSSFL